MNVCTGEINSPVEMKNESEGSENKNEQQVLRRNFIELYESLLELWNAGYIFYEMRTVTKRQIIAN